MLMIFTFSSEEERDKFEYLYAKYKNLMLHKAYGILGDHMLAEDAVSEALIRIYKNLHKVEDPDTRQSAAFVVTIAKNCALTILDKEKRKGQDTEDIDAALPDSFDLERHILSEQAAGEIYAVVDSLGEDLKAVFLLKYAYDMPHREIGNALGITENNVTVRLHRAKKKLAGLLAERGYARGQGQ